MFCVGPASLDCTRCVLVEGELIRGPVDEDVCSVVSSRAVVDTLLKDIVGLRRSTSALAGMKWSMSNFGEILPKNIMRRSAEKERSVCVQ